MQSEGFLTAFTSARYLYLSWARSIQSMPPPRLPTHFFKIRVNIILPATSRSSNWFSSLGYPKKTHLSCSPDVLYAPPISVDHTYIWWAVQILKFLVTRSSPFPCHLVPLRPAYLPQHLILEQTRPVFLPQCECPRLKPIQNNMQNYNSLYLDLYIYILGVLYVTNMHLQYFV